MQFRKKDEKNLLKVGLFISGLTAILMIMIVSISKENSFFESNIHMKAQVDNVKNLKPGEECVISAHAGWMLIKRIKSF